MEMKPSICPHPPCQIVYESIKFSVTKFGIWDLDGGKSGMRVKSHTRGLTQTVTNQTLNMAATGVSVDDSVIAQFNDIKLGRVKAKFIIYRIDNGVIVTESVGNSENFDDFIAMMPADDCRYSMYDMNFMTNDGRPGNKLVFISWAPDTAKIKAKMVYAGSKDALTRALVGVSTKISASDLSELTQEIVVEACKKFA